MKEYSWGLFILTAFIVSSSISKNQNRHSRIDLPPPNILWITCEVLDRYRDWLYSMFIGFALDQTYLNCGLELPNR